MMRGLQMEKRRSRSEREDARGAGRLAAAGMAALIVAAPITAAAEVSERVLSERSQAPRIVSYDAPPSRGVPADETEARVAALATPPSTSAAPNGSADPASDALGMGLNPARAAEGRETSAGAAFAPGALERIEEIRAIVGPVSPPTVYGEALRSASENAPEEVRRFYWAMGWRPLWIDAPTGETARAQGLLRAFQAAADHALPVEAYGGGVLEEALAALVGAEQADEPAAVATATAMDFEAAAQLEFALTDAYLRLASDLSGGFVRPRSVSRDVDRERPKADPLILLDLAQQADDPVALVEKLPPQTADYKRLRAIYAGLRAIAENGDWGPEATAPRSIRPLDRGPQVDRLRARLIALGDLSPTAPRAAHPETGDTLHDAVTEAALKRFQRRHGLAVDGVAGRNTLGALNVSAQDRAQQIALNMERARWANRPMDGRRVLVNIPDLHVDIFDDGAPTYRSRVVVGTRRHQTPEFDDEMNHLVVNPFWHIPNSIATEQYLPELRKFPGAMQARGIHIFERGRRVDPFSVDWWRVDPNDFPFRMRQDPGRRNALGDVKFMFPNKHAVYLHDTPAKRLFKRNRRAYSHGCIRVATPTLLAKTLLAAQTDDPAAEYNRLRRMRGERHVQMEQPVPVHLIYRTAWVDAEGALQIRPDLYGRDARMATAMRNAGFRL
ncbi:MAG: L,D-transpeptidase family protein [Pseudomonadota bacterium]